MVSVPMLLLSLTIISAAIHTIDSVSLSPSAYLPASGSLEGGQVLYINGSGFTNITTLITLQVGPYSCPLEAGGATTSQLICRTKIATMSTQLVLLPMKVIINGTTVICSTAMCTYNYTSSKTPLLTQIIPKTISPGEVVNIFGTQRISSPINGTYNSEIKKIQIGTQICDFGIFNQIISPLNLRGLIRCKSEVLSIAGQTSLLVDVSNGYSRLSRLAVFTSFLTGLNYTVRVISQITLVSSRKTGALGQILTVNGNGFSSNITDYSCLIAGEICTVIKASLNQLTVQIPAILLNKTNFGSLEKDVADVSIQEKPFLGSYGAEYWRFQTNGITKTGPQWLTYLRNSPSLNLLEFKIIAELSSPEVYRQNYVQYIKGYFHAPVSGVYNFSGLSSHLLYMEMSRIRNNANIANLEVLISYNLPANSWLTPFERADVQKNNASLFLTTGYYYFEIVNLNAAGPGYFKLYADMPSMNQYTMNCAWGVHKFIIKPAINGVEVINVKVFAGSGSFSLYYTDASNILRNMTVPFGTSATNFKNLLVNLPNINTYLPTITSFPLDSLGNPTSSPPFSGYQYNISLTKYRVLTALPNTDSMNLIAGSMPVSLQVTRLWSPLSGTFMLSINNVPLLINNSTNIPYNTVPAVLQTQIRKFYINDGIKVYRILNTVPEQSIQFVIDYIGVRFTPYSLSFNLSQLTGGSAGNQMNISMSTIRQFTNRELYAPIAYQLLRVASFSSTLQIFDRSLPIRNIYAPYIYSIDSTLQIVSARPINSIFNIQISNPGFIYFQFSNINVTILGVQCNNFVGSILNFNCSVAKNTDGSNLISAGYIVPIVHVTQIGYANTSSFVPQCIPLVVTNIYPSQAGIAGQIEAQIDGSGFPLSSSLGLALMICGNVVTNYTMISNQQLKFIIPTQVNRCNNSNTYVAYNNIETAFFFSYNPCLPPQDPFRCVIYDINSPLDGRENFLRVWSNISQWPNQHLPNFNQSVVIPYEWNLILDIDPPTLFFVEINGILNFDRTRDNKFEAHYIWVKNGIIRIGSKLNPFLNQATIILHGSKSDNKMVIDGSASGSKVLAVTGGIQFFGRQPKYTWMRLQQPALAGSQHILVQFPSEWSVGDEIAISPSSNSSVEYESRKIVSIVNNLISLNQSLNFDHQGSVNSTISQYGMDIRSSVALLTRNIKIKSADLNQFWGCQLLINGYKQGSNWNNGYAKLSNVQVQGCGQQNSSSAIRIQNLDHSIINQSTQIVKSVIRSCLGTCVSIKNISHVHMNKNLLADSQTHLVKSKMIHLNFTFTKNLLIGAVNQRSISNSKNMAAYYQYDNLPASTNWLISQNIVQGSGGAGFIFPLRSCSQPNSFTNNIASSCSTGFVFFNSSASTICSAASTIKGYFNQIGSIFTNDISHIQVSQIIIVESSSTTFSFFSDHMLNTTILFNDVKVYENGSFKQWFILNIKGWRYASTQIMVIGQDNSRTLITPTIIFINNSQTLPTNCGEYILNSATSQIELMVTSGCQLAIQQSNSISLRLSINISYSNYLSQNVTQKILNILSSDFQFTLNKIAVIYQGGSNSSTDIFMNIRQGQGGIYELDNSKVDLISSLQLKEFQVKLGKQIIEFNIEQDYTIEQVLIELDLILNDQLLMCTLIPILIFGAVSISSSIQKNKKRLRQRVIERGCQIQKVIKKQTIQVEMLGKMQTDGCLWPNFHEDPPQILLSDLGGSINEMQRK